MVKVPPALVGPLFGVESTTGASKVTLREVRIFVLSRRYLDSKSVPTPGGVTHTIDVKDFQLVVEQTVLPS
jgi:hypothetical protein